MPLDKEQFASAVVPNHPQDKVEINVGSFPKIVDMSTLWGHMNLMLTNVVWSPDASFENSISHGNAIGKLEIPKFYDRDLRDALLPNFLEGESGRKMLNILVLKFYITYNEWSYRQRPSEYHSPDSDPIADSFYNAKLKLKIGTQEVNFDLLNFYGDTRTGGSRDDGYIDTMRRGDLYDAIYLLSVIPEEAWKAVWNTEKTDYSFAGYRFIKKKDGTIRVTPDNRIGNPKVAPILIVNRQRVGANDVKLGRLDPKKKGW